MARSGKRGLGRLSLSVVILLVVLVAVSLIGVSPFALGLFHGATSEWERLSFIGQTYGAASAVISVLALVGIVLTLGYQARETIRAREETRREAVSDLLKMAMNDPDLDVCLPCCIRRSWAAPPMPSGSVNPGRERHRSCGQPSERERQPWRTGWLAGADDRVPAFRR